MATTTLEQKLAEFGVPESSIPQLEALIQSLVSSAALAGADCEHGGWGNASASFHPWGFEVSGMGPIVRRFGWDGSRLSQEES